MWKLTIEDDEGKRTALPLARDEYTIGRAEENTVRLTERNISRRHALLRRSGNQWLLIDCVSSNGSYVNGTRHVGEHLLAPGDVVQFGDYRLEFSDEDATARTAGANVATLPGAGAAAAKPDRLVVVIGPEPGEEFVIRSAQVTIGRAPELDVCLAHTSVSRVHAEIHALGSGRYEVLDRGSANGVRVNGSLLKRGLLEAGDFIELGEVKLKFVGAGQAYRPGPEAMRLSSPPEAIEADTVRPPPASHSVFGTTSSIEAAAEEPGVRPRSGRLWMLGAAGAIIGVAALFFYTRNLRPPATPAGSPTPSATQAVHPASPDPARQALDEIEELAAQGNLDAAHQRIAVEVSSFPSLADAPEVREIESRWADAVLTRAGKERNIAARRTLLSSVAQATTVDAGRRRTAADKLKEADFVGTDVQELPKVRAPSPGPTPAPASASELPSKMSRPFLAADPWSSPAPTPTRASSAATALDGSSSKATDLALQGRDGESKARAQLEPRVWSGRASPDEIRMLRAICKHMGDRVCIERASALLGGQK
jgi:pSer/pThr/pTyr-binding forkhead associated (FHA) protein